MGYHRPCINKPQDGASTKNELQHNGFKIHLSNQIEDRAVQKELTSLLHETSLSFLIQDDVGGIRLIGNKRPLLFIRTIDICN